jgi:hypothetical protein
MNDKTLRQTVMAQLNGKPVRPSLIINEVAAALGVSPYEVNCAIWENAEAGMLEILSDWSLKRIGGMGVAEKILSEQE